MSADNDMRATRIPTVILGGTGYVAGELLRLIAGHPNLSLAGIMSDSQPGELIAKTFGHLAPVYPDETFKSQAEVETILTRESSTAVLCAAPHGAAAALIDALLTRAEAAKTRPHVVDISADYRYRTADAYQAVYHHPHGAPARLNQFTCAVPEHLKELTTPHVAHPGCFATAVLLAVVPMLALGLAAPEIFVSGVTGSTGSGRKPSEGTHHPQRHSDLYSYNPLGHRHTPEIEALSHAASGVEAQISFVPHSGPFARGIHVTAQTRLLKPIDTAAVQAALRQFYAHSPFVRVGSTMPRVKDVAGSNYAQLSAVSNGRTLAVMATLDNLNKGAAGGAVQWMNRLYGLDETAGLTAPAAGWT